MNLTPEFRWRIRACMHTPYSVHSRYQYSVPCALCPLHLGPQNQMKIHDSQQPFCGLQG